MPKNLSARLKVSARLNVRTELVRLRVDPLDSLVRRLAKGRKPSFVLDELTRYLDAYGHYSLTLARFYRELSIGFRWRNGAYFTQKYRRRYTPYERRLTDQYRLFAP